MAKQEIVHMRHPQTEGTATATRKAFDLVWNAKGWEEYDPAAGAAVGSDLMDLTRDDLNAAARDAGVTDPESLPNKRAVVAAIKDTGS